MARKTQPITRPTPSLQSLPWAIRGGVHDDLLAPDSTTFVLHAPFKRFVSLVGDFNNWNSRAHPMLTDGRGTWWITVPRVQQTRYGFYVAVDEQSHVWVGDPYARELRWDQRGPCASLPQREAGFVWTDAAWRTPAIADLVIYELNVRDFAGAWERNRPRYGDFRRMLQRLDHIVATGVNAVELMPIQAFPGQSSWGYNPVFYFAVAGVYGGPNDFKRFVDACHARGVAVILDVAFNHAWGEHPYYRYYPPMFGPEGQWLDDWNPFFHHTPRSVNSWGGVDWDHFVSDTTRYFQDVVRFWLAEYHVDGFRFDWACGVDYDSSNPMDPGFNPYHGISALCWAARQQKPDCILIGEYWQLDCTNPAKTAAKLVAESEMDAVWNGAFHHTLETVLNQHWQWEKADIFRAIGGYREEGFTAASQVINYTCSHDEVRPEHEIKYYSGKYISPPRPMDADDVALSRAWLGLVALFTAPGVPMIYAGQEFGEDTPRTIDFLPLMWDKLREPRHSTYYDRVCRLVALRRGQPALRSNFIRFYDDDFPTNKLVRYDRWDGVGGFVAVAINFDTTPHATWLQLPNSHAWVDALSGAAYRPARGRVSLSLAPWQAVVLAPAAEPG